MKISLSILLLLWMALSGCSDKPSLEELKKFAATEKFPEDAYFDTVQNKRALVIVAHDDDDCAMSGTIAKLTAAGWKIRQLSFQFHPVTGTGQLPVSLICEGHQLILADQLYRPGLDTMKTPYLPIAYETIGKQFLREKVADSLLAKINSFQPSVVFTLDNEKGGYGHPEHIFISQLVLDLFNERRFFAQRIYQSVYTNHMEKEIVDTWLKAQMEKWGFPHASTIANELYGISGMPEPTVQVTIKGQSEIKMKYQRAYDEEVRKNLRKFIPYYEEFEAEEYFTVFDREFFRVIQH